MNTHRPALTAREVCQLLRDAALGVRTLQRLDPPGAAGHVKIDIEGWRLTLDLDEQRLRHCQGCQSPDGREGVFESWQRYGTDPVSLLSTWELTQIERLLAEGSVGRTLQADQLISAPIGARLARE